MKFYSTNLLMIVLLAITFHTSSRSNAAVSCRSFFEKARVDFYSFDLVRQMRQKISSSSKAEEILDQIIELLKNDEIVDIRFLGGGATASYLVTLKSGIEAVYKPINLERPNQIQREVAAYKISRLFKLDIVPPTILRSIKKSTSESVGDEVQGSFQLFVKTAKPLEKGIKDDQKIIFMKNEIFLVEDHLAGRRLRIFDWLINNHDRGTNAGNYLVSEVDKFIIGIDHSTSFIGHDKQARKDKVPFYKGEFLNDKEFYFRLKSASENEIRGALKDLNPVRVEEFLERYKILIENFERILKI